MTEIRRTIRASNGGVSLGENAPTSAPASIENSRNEAEKNAALAQLANRAGAPALEDHCVELQLPNGKIIVMGPPKVGTMTLLARLLGDGMPNLIQMNFLKSLLYIRSIDGVPQALPQNDVDVQKLSNELGYNGEEIIQNAFNTFWPPLGEGDLPVIRKSI